MASAPARQLNSKVCSLIFNLAVHVFSFMGNRGGAGQLSVRSTNALCQSKWLD